jgi:predicted Zn-dependent protease
VRKCETWRTIILLFGLMVSPLGLIACSSQVTLPTVSDDRVETLVRTEATRIISVSEDKQHLSEYHIFLSDFPRKDVLGMSVGKRRIYISHELAKLASRETSHLWLLRQTLAHEIAHETAGHARQSSGASLARGLFARSVSNMDIGLPARVTLRNYSAEKEFEADAKGLQYWTRLGWDCRIWVRILQSFEKQNYIGDTLHPTAERLRRARAVCQTDDAL